MQAISLGSREILDLVEFCYRGFRAEGCGLG